MIFEDAAVAHFAPHGPLPKDGGSGQGEVCLAVSGTAILIAIPSWMQGKLCEFTAIGAGVDVLYGAGSGMTAAVYNQATTVDGTSKALTVHAASGRNIPSTTTRRWMVPPAGSGVTHMSIIASGAGFLSIGVISSTLQK